ncbi:DNA (cytosine-5-)-methyltransferase [Gammaproteobacteria bacterium]|jgi:DNA (cytosine-5)-methyltransferase 1|nr:DNA (cytosine-5-)-methyltransferase [Gammaproteobacteria bacterium]
MSTFVKRKYRINKKEYINNESTYQFISLFSGCGGLDLGASLNGCKVISSLDNDHDSIKSLSLNKVFSNAEHNLDDIRGMTAKKYSNIIQVNNPEKLFLIGGPPCQPFSKAAYWQTHAKRKGKDDPKNMIDPYLDLIGEIKPDGFILENVESILHPKNHFYLDHIKERIDKLGFNLSIFKLNSADFGVPQKRKRVFFMAKLNSQIQPFIPSHGDTKAIALNKKLKKYERVIDWIGEYDDIKFSDGYDSIEGKYKKDLMNVIPGKNYIYLTSKYNYPNPKFLAGTRYWTFLLKLDPELPSNTIISSPGHWEGPFHWNNRRLRVKELAAIQSFPCDYQFYGSRRSIIKQIGNAVPPILAKVVIKNLIGS